MTDIAIIPIRNIIEPANIFPIKPKIAMSITTFLLFGLLTKLEYDEFKIFFESYLLLLLGNFSARYQRLYSRGAI